MYAAELAGLGYNLANTKYGITLGIKVPSNFCLWVKGIMVLVMTAVSIYMDEIHS